MKVKSLFRFAHISDLHFSRLFFSPMQFFSKRWIGNLNLMINRKKNFDQDHLYTLIPLFQKLDLDGIFISGDLTSTSHPSEFKMAKQYVDALIAAGLKVFLIPGNHDHYTRHAYRTLSFYRYFNSASLSEDSMSFFKLKDDKISATHLGKNWWLFCLDSTLATPLLSSHGVFSEKMQDNLDQALSYLPSDQNVILMNHFPLFDSEGTKKCLHRSEDLCKVIQKFPQIKLYIHGHTHRHIIADLRPSHLPIILDSGSTAQKKGATWNLIDLSEEGCEVSVYKRSQPADKEKWAMQSQVNFSWS